MDELSELAETSLNISENESNISTINGQNELSDGGLSAEPAKLPPAPSFRAVLVQFLKQLATSSTDLHRITAPAIMLNGVSLLEYMTHWCDHPSLLAAIPEEPSHKGSRH